MSEINILVCCINEHWFIFLGVTAERDSTNLTGIWVLTSPVTLSWSPDGVNSIKAPKKDNWTSISEIIICLICWPGCWSWISLYQNSCIATHLFEVHVLCMNGMLFLCFHFTHKIVLLSFIRIKVNNKNG